MSRPNPNVPKHLQHPDGRVEAVLIIAHYAGEIGPDAAHRLAGDILARHDQSVYEQVDVIAGLLDEWAACQQDVEQYAYDNGLSLPYGTPRYEWQEATLDVLAADAAMLAEKLAARTAGAS